jgi:hypothetical protein
MIERDRTMCSKYIMVIISSSIIIDIIGVNLNDYLMSTRIMITLIVNMMFT